MVDPASSAAIFSSSSTDISSLNHHIAASHFPSNATSLRRRSRHASRDDHPLDGEEPGSPPDSRPSLRRLTGETERQVAESSRSGSERGSLDMLRMTTPQDKDGTESAEIEVLIHKVGPAMSCKS